MALTDHDIKRIVDAVVPATALATQNYRNPKADKASVDAGLGRIPDAYGYLVQTHQLVTKLTANLAELTKKVTELESRQQ